MCHTIHYSDRDKTEFCEDGRLGRKCKLTEEWVSQSRKHVLSKLDLSKMEPSSSLADRLPTPYAYMPPSPHADGPGVYVNGTKVVELSKPRKHRDEYDRDYHYERRSSRHVDLDPRDRDNDRHDRDRRSRHDDRDVPSKLKRSSTLPQYVVIEQEKPRRRSRDGYDGPADLTKEYLRRRRSRSRERDSSPDRGLYYRKHTANGYVFVDDEKERRQQRREQRERRRSMDYDSEPPVFSTAALRYTPRRSSTIVHRSDGTTVETKPSTKTKQLRWDDEVRVKRDLDDIREVQNRKIASRPKQRSDPDRDPRLKGILKNTKLSREEEEHRAEERRRDEELRRAVEEMGIHTRGRSPKPQEWTEQVARLRSRFGDEDRGDYRSKRSKVWLDDRYVYR